MPEQKVTDAFYRAAEVFYYGDHITGDALLMNCLQIMSRLYEVDSQKAFVLESMRSIKQARTNEDFIEIADILRYEVAPKLMTH